MKCTRCHKYPCRCTDQRDVIAEHYGPKWRARLRRAIGRYTRAYNADSWKGGGDPDDIPAIEQELRSARKALSALLK